MKPVIPNLEFKFLFLKNSYTAIYYIGLNFLINFISISVDLYNIFLLWGFPKNSNP